MAWEKPDFMISMEANADLSAKQYYFVEIVTGYKADVCNAATDRPIGILQNKPKAGETAEIMVSGVSKVSADGVVALGDQIGTSADGQADVKTAGTDTTEYVVGVALEAAAAAAEIIAVLINCATPHRAA